MAAAVIVLSIIIVLLIAFIVILLSQLRSINRQLTERLAEHTRKPLSIELINHELNDLAANINKSFKAEEALRLEGIREEKHFKEMIADISHDLRTPLTAVKGYQQLLEKGGLTDEQRQKLKIAQKHADKLGNLIEHFFEYSYILNADIQPHPECLNLVNLTAECLADSIDVIEGKGLTVRFDDSPPIFALADKEMTSRIIQNLIQNCVRHSNGSIEIRIFKSKNAVLSIKNPVCANENIDVQRIFDRFYTADKSRGSSTGLGLSIVRLLAEQMGGCTNALLKDGLLEIQVELPLHEE